MGRPVIRRPHFTDIIHPDDSALRQRTYINHRNYFNPFTGLWTPSRLNVRAEGQPPGWEGTFDFSHGNVQSPLEFFVRDTTDVSNRAMFGVRIGKRPRAWMNVKAAQTNPVEPVFLGKKTVRFNGLWDGCDWILKVAWHRVEQTVRIHDKSIAPSKFSFTIRLGPGYTMVRRRHLIEVVETSTGKVVKTLSRAIAWDRDGDENAPNIPVTTRLLDPVGPLWVLELEPDAAAMAASTGNVFIDPTITAQTTSEIEDAWLRPGGNAGKNYGATASGGQLNTVSNDNIMSRIQSGTLPAAGSTVDSCTLTLSTSTTGAISRTARIRYYEVDWVEGTGNGLSNPTGMCTKNHAQHDTLVWGSFVLQDLTQSYTFPGDDGDGLNHATINIDTATVQTWVEGTKASDGVRLSTQSGTVGGMYFSEIGDTNAPFWTINYTEGASGGVPMLFRHRRRYE